MNADISRYGPLAQLLHWVIAALVMIIIPIGLIVHFHWAPKSNDSWLLMFHIGFGLTVFALMALRLLRRWIDAPPPLPDAIGPMERAAARANHYLFYALLFAMPIVGVIFVEAKNHKISWFGLFNLPMLVGKSAPLHHWFAFLHFWGGFMVIALILAHLAGVFRHDVMHKNRILQRMLPGQAVGKRKYDHRNVR